MKIIAPPRQPSYRPIKDKMARVQEEITYIFISRGITYSLTIHKGFIFDGASIPRAMWSFLGLTPLGSMAGPALPHDFGYHYKGRFPLGSYRCWDKYNKVWVNCLVPMPKKDLDALLEELCLHFEVCGEEKAFLIWAAVRSFGWLAWNRDDEKRKSQQKQRGVGFEAGA